MPLVSEKRSGSKMNIGSCVRTNLLTILTVSGVIAGVALGVGLRSAKDEWSQREATYIRFLGDLFLRMLKSLIVPLIVSSLIFAIGSLDLSLSGRIGSRAVVYYLLTTVCAVVLGIILVVSIAPGKGGEKNEDVEDQESRNVTTPDTLMDLVRNMFPPNLIQATIEQYQTTLIYPGNDSIRKKYK